MEEKRTILIAEDDKDIVELMKLYLNNGGYEVLSANDGVKAYEIIESKKVDLCIFDVMMPRMNGYELIKKVREKYNLPIIVVSAKNQDSDKIIGLDLGADDYLTKPFNPLELVARVRSGLRRFYKLNDNASDSENSIISAGELILNTRDFTLHKNEEEIILTPTEFKILMLLMQSPGRVFTKAQIYEYANGEYFENDENTLMVHISNLRDKIEDDSKSPKYLKTVRGLGYKFERQS